MKKKAKRFFLFFFVFLLLAGQLLTFPVAAQMQVYRKANTSDMRIALTFDDGPHPTLTAKILAILAKYQVKATFFMIGENVEYYTEAARQVVDAGHEIGNHTYSHKHMKEMSKSELEAEIGKCESTIMELCHYTPTLFRPPEGGITTALQSSKEHEHYSIILWSIDTRDWECLNTKEIVKSVLSNVKGGDIILMHDYIGRKSKTPEALECLLPELLARGYQPVTVSELLGIG